MNEEGPSIEESWISLKTPALWKGDDGELSFLCLIFSTQKQLLQIPTTAHQLFQSK